MSENVLIVEDEYIVANDLTIILESAGYQVCGTADTVAAAMTAIVQLKPTWVLLDIFLRNGSMGTELAPFLHEKGIGFIYISANTNQSILEIAKASQPYGFLVKPFRENDLLIMLDIARSRHENSLHFAAQRALLLQQQVKNLAEAGIAFQNKLAKIPAAFQSLIPFDYLAFSFQDKQHAPVVTGAFYRVGFDEYQIVDPNTALPDDLIFLTNEDHDPVVVKLFPNLPQELPGSLITRYQLKTSLQFQYTIPAGTLKIGFFNKNNDAFDHAHTSLLLKNAQIIFNTFSTLATDAVGKNLRSAARLKPTAAKFDGIYGNSAALLHVLDNVELVANTPASVLILGESGTGKEKIAHNIHQLSSRAKAAFITVNCAAMPAELIESELFGHEKGAFTGAVEKRIGKFELAHGGTIFLDEVGELPLAAQVKLLRVLQERQFESVGSNKVVKIDVRIVAATNRNLEKAVAEGLFRLDLFYRLNVYPIQMPPLRDRKEDIPVLAEYFLTKSAATMDRDDVPTLSSAAIQQLADYYWPGNIRELEHLMERTLIQTRQAVIDYIELPKNTVDRDQTGAGPVKKTLEQMEIEHIRYALNSCKGKITGTDGAARILGLPPSTLTSKMKRLGISRDQFN